MPKMSDSLLNYVSHTMDMWHHDHQIVALIANVNHEGGGCCSLYIGGLLYSTSNWPILHLVVSDVRLNIGLSVTEDGWSAHMDCLVVCLLSMNVFRRHFCGCKGHGEKWHDTCSGLTHTHTHTRKHAHTHTHTIVHNAGWLENGSWTECVLSTPAYLS